uniref:Ribosomal protein S11 n=1 Tax=Synarthrophyton chejuense TaxID=2485825 RepID=A0A3G3MII6_9FLOR|nr:ribosomal protein S11 [Synarthrophyton chejuense]AYR06640.1 ribosomal protein S11 [Synarthrophyton chejuense]
MIKKIMKLYNNKSIILLVLLKKNNIICVLTTLSGKVLTWVTTGSLKLRGTRKITSLTIISSLKLIYTYIYKFNCNNVHIKIKGINKNKNLFIKYLKSIGFNIISFQEIPLLPYNGCKNNNIRRI